MIIVLTEILSQKLILANIYAPNLDDQKIFPTMLGLTWTYFPRAREDRPTDGV